MRASWGPAHLLPLDEPPGNDLVDGRFHKSRRNTFPTPMTLPIVGDARSIVVDVGTKILKGTSQFLQYQVSGPPRLTVLFNRAVCESCSMRIAM